jgi:hypothetical protein
MLTGRFSTLVRGLPYYRAVVETGGQVRFVHNPLNVKDVFAQEVRNSSNGHVGHLPKELVNYLTPLVLNQRASLSYGVMPQGSEGMDPWVMPVWVYCSFSEEHRHALEMALLYSNICGILEVN